MQGQLWRNAKYFLFLTPVILSPVFMAMGAAVLLGSYLGRLGSRGKSWRKHDGRGRASGTFLPLIAIVRPRLPSPGLLAPEMRERQAFQCQNSESTTYISGRFRDCRQVRDSCCGEWS